MDLFDEVLKFGKDNFGLKIQFKDQSTSMKILGFFMFFNKKFMKSYSTTLGNVVYFPSKVWLEADRDRAARILAHELVHISDSKSMGEIEFSYSYLFPQILSTISICFFLGCSPWFLLFLLFLLPLPSPTRTYWELRGYAVTDMVNYKQTGKFVPIEQIEKQFVSSSYYFMWPFKNHINKLIEENRKLIADNRLSEKINIADKIKSLF